MQRVCRVERECGVREMGKLGGRYGEMGKGKRARA
jgi:hypothetical protein